MIWYFALFCRFRNCITRAASHPDYIILYPDIRYILWSIRRVMDFVHFGWYFTSLYIYIILAYIGFLGYMPPPLWRLNYSFEFELASAWISDASCYLQIVYQSVGKYHHALPSPLNNFSRSRILDTGHWISSSTVIEALKHIVYNEEWYPYNVGNPIINLLIADGFNPTHLLWFWAGLLILWLLLPP